MLGFEVQIDAPYREGWRWIFLSIPGAKTRLHFAKTTEMELHSTPALCLESDDVDAEAARLKSAGVEITDGPDDAPWAPGVRWLMIRDSESNLVLLESRT
ncbi:MAG: VOC family protein [Rhodobacteraceae bacterium]|nr:VOC family protein [Paracoccaceae bacterium]